VGWSVCVGGLTCTFSSLHTESRRSDELREIPHYAAPWEKVHKVIHNSEGLVTSVLPSSPASPVTVHWVTYTRT
jgi:hypothetical protein